MKRCWRRLLVACLLWAAVLASYADTLLWGGVPLVGQVLVDPSGRQTVDQVQARFDQGEGAPQAADRFYPSQAPAAIWFRFTFPAAAQPAQDVLTLPHPGINRVDLFQRNAAGAWTAQHAGDALPVSQWAIPHLHPAFAVELPPGMPVTVLARVEHNHSITMPWRLRGKADFEASNKRLLLALGAYLGFVMLVVGLSVLNWLAWRDRLHLTYAVYVVSVGFTQMSLTGLAGQFIWPNAPRWNDFSAVVLPLLSAAMASWFIYDLVAERASRWLRGLLAACCAAGLLLAAGFSVFDREWMFGLANGYFASCLVLGLGALSAYARRNPRVGGWFLAGFMALSVGALFAVLRNLGLLPVSPLTQFGTQIGGALEIPLLLVGLYFRSRERHDNQIRLSALARVDPLTGLSTHRVLMERLEHLLQRQRRYPGQGVVLRVRVGNRLALREEFGLEALQVVLVHTGACVARIASDGDTVARHRDGDFVLLLDDSLSREQVAEIAQRIIARGLMIHSKRLPAGAAPRLLVAAALAPARTQDAAALLGALDRLLGEIEAHPTKALRFLAT